MVIPGVVWCNWAVVAACGVSFALTFRFDERHNRMADDARGGAGALAKH